MVKAFGYLQTLTLSPSIVLRVFEWPQIFASLSYNTNNGVIPSFHIILISSSVELLDNFHTPFDVVQHDQTIQNCDIGVSCYFRGRLIKVQC